MLTLTKAGRYEISGELGRGAMGVVYHAKDPVIGRAVAVKTLQLSEQGTGMTRAELLARFQTEARAAGHLAHPNIVVIFDAGEEDGLFFITMELVEGKSLQHMLDAGQMFPIPRMLRIMEQTCSALQFAHERNIVHRDIKPANLMLTPDDTVKITDFGTAKILQFGTVQQTAHVMGTPSYMSPEQIKGKVVDGRSDIFSLGVVLYEMVTGEKPFPGQNITTVIYKIVNEQPAAPRDIDSSIHPGLNSIIMKSLVKEPSERYQTCRELFEDLRNYRSLSAAINPNATLPAAGLLHATQPHRSAFENAQLDATSRALTAHAAGPSQTPMIRRTGAIAPVPQPEAATARTTVLAAIFLLAVIVFGAQKIRPIFQAARLQSGEIDPSSQANRRDVKTVSANSQTPETSQLPESNPAKIAVVSDPILPTLPSAHTPAVAPVDLPSSATAETKTKVEEFAKAKHFRNRLAIAASGTTLRLSGKLRPSEYRELLNFLHDAPAGVQVIDAIKYESDAADDSASADSSNRPAVAVGSDPAHPVDRSPDSQPDHQPRLDPALAPPIGEQSQSGNIHVAWAQVDSTPSGAEIWIDGAPIGRTTPTRIQIASGIHHILLNLQGYRLSRSAVEASDGGTVNVAPILRKIR